MKEFILKLINSHKFEDFTFIELLLHKLRTTTCGNSDEISEALEPLNLQGSYKACTPFYHHYLGEPTTYKRSERKAELLAPRSVYLSRASLVIVPASLIGQWLQEINKHCSFPLHVLSLRSIDNLPSVRSLATEYDVGTPLRPAVSIDLKYFFPSDCIDDI